MKNINSLGLIELMTATLNQLDARGEGCVAIGDRIDTDFGSFEYHSLQKPAGHRWSFVWNDAELVRAAREQYGTDDLGRLFEAARKGTDADAKDRAWSTVNDAEATV